MAKNLRLAKQGSYARLPSHASPAVRGWGIGEALEDQRFFSDTFKKELPVAVFGQGAIHERWRLDHRNAMDISLHLTARKVRRSSAFCKRTEFLI